MKLGRAVLVPLLLVGAAAVAQTPVPMPPVIGPSNDPPPGPAVPLSNESLYGAPPTTGAPPPPTATPPPASPAPQAAAPAPPPGPPQPPLNDAWQPRGGVDLKALDKVNARSLTLAGRVGQAVRYATLTIQVRACVVRPPDQPADSAAFLDITDSRQNMPSFHGWMFSGEPGIAILEHPLFDVRVVGCRA